MFFWIGFFELVTLPALFETMNGSGRAPGDFMFDPLGLGKGAGRARMELAEIKNGRLAMIATGQSAHPKCLMSRLSKMSDFRAEGLLSTPSSLENV